MAENQSFAAQVSEWATQEKARQEAVLREAAQMVANNVRTSVAAGGRMPVDTGNLKNSLMASTSAMPTVDQGEKEYPDQGGEIELIISTSKSAARSTSDFRPPTAAWRDRHLFSPLSRKARSGPIAGTLKSAPAMAIVTAMPAPSRCARRRRKSHDVVQSLCPLYHGRRRDGPARD
ncbi:hypothetical protein [Ensifer aridi]|uniref:hypothetical protein n=1 Tax=Ensifer aridi TaxID=1708715 RepID=UPI001FCD9101|nr:hypothetical protein [Ensifer aridi]